MPIVLLDGQRVRSATAAAGALRIRAGMTIAEARSRCATLRVAHWDEDSVARAVTRATATFVQASPQVTPVGGTPGTWWVGASGLEALGGERALARRLLALARRWHPGARVGIADSCVAARAATWATTGTGRQGRPGSDEGAPMEDGIVIVPPGGCAAYLAPAPLGLVPMDEELRDTLQALGLRTVGAFAALPTEDVERRWGSAGVAAWHLARGEDERRPVLARLDAPRAVATDLSPSVPSVEPIIFLVRAALDRLVQDLVQDGRAAAVVAITLALDDARGALPTATHAHTVTREVRLPRPLARVIPLLERCRALLEEWRLDAPVCGVTVAVTATAPLHGAQGELLDPAWRDPAAADAAFARLRATLGIEAVVRPVVRDTHRPERAGVWERVDDPSGSGRREGGDGRKDGAGDGDARGDARGPAPSPSSAVASHHSPGDVMSRPHASAAGSVGSGGIAPHATSVPASRSLALVREVPPVAIPRPFARPLPPSLLRAPALRQLETPERAEVRTADGTVTSAPRTIRWREHVITVARAIGPERLTGDWWESGYARDYWRCEDSAGTSHLVLYRDCAAPDHAWYIHGWYD